MEVPVTTEHAATSRTQTLCSITLVFVGSPSGNFNIRWLEVFKGISGSRGDKTQRLSSSTLLQGSYHVSPRLLCFSLDAKIQWTFNFFFLWDCYACKMQEKNTNLLYIYTHIIYSLFFYFATRISSTKRYIHIHNNLMK